MRVGFYLILGLAAVLEWCALGAWWQAGRNDVSSAEASAGVAVESKPIAASGANFAGTVHSDIWRSAEAAGLEAQEMAQLAEIFAWQLDFSRDLQAGDRWRLVLDEPSPGGKARRIAAAEVEHNGQIYRAIGYGHGVAARYFADDGTSLQRQFLHSPLYQTHVTSAFARHRFHPILQVSLPHLGVDYGAPFGTPVMAAGTGVVTAANFQGGSGKTVVLSHGHRYETRYKHLSRFARGLKVGERVKMGQVIAYVGATGLATGPHLHYEFYDGAKVINPQTLRFPAVESIAAAERPAFQGAVDRVLARLPRWSSRTEVASGH